MQLTSHGSLRGRFERRHVVALAAAVAALAVAPFILGVYPVALLTLALAYGLFAFGLDIAWGRASVISIGHAAFFGLGAYGPAIAIHLGFPMALGTGAGIALAALLALAMATVGLSRKALPSTMAVLTLAVTLLAEQTARSWLNVTNGSNGIFVPSRGLIGNYYSTAVVVLIVVVAVWFFGLRGRFGRRMLAVSVNEQRTENLGVDPIRTKTTAFVLSAVIAAIAGAVAAPVIGLVAPGVAGIVMSTQVLVWLAVGGRGTILGAFLGAGLVTIGQEYLGDAIGSWYLLVLGISFILIVKFAPGGLVGLAKHIWRSPLSRRAARDAVIAVPVTVPEPPALPSDVPALNLVEVTKSFGSVPVLEGISLSIPNGQVVCLIGPNGAGKTTLLNIIAGSLPATSGVLAMSGTDITQWPPYRRAQHGLGRLFQIPSVYPELTPAQNMRLAQAEAYRGVTLPHELSRFENDESVRAQDLSLADQRSLELAMAIAWGPEIVLLDEPAAGLSHEDSVGLARTLRRVNAELGCTLIIVEHDMDIVRQLADRVIVLADGHLLVDGDMDEVAANERVRNAYLGVVDHA